MARRNYYARRNYQFTARRRVALKKAQAKSAQKRKGMSTRKKVAIGVAGVIGAGVVGHKVSGSALGISMHKAHLQGTSTRQTTYHGPLEFSNGFRVGGGKTSTVSPHVVPAGVQYNRTGNEITSLVRVRPNTRALRISYRLGRQRPPVPNVLGTRTRAFVDTSPDQSNNPSRNFTDARANQNIGGSAPSRAVGFGHYPLDEDRKTYSSVRSTLARRIMAEGGNTVFGRRTGLK